MNKNKHEELPISTFSVPDIARMLDINNVKAYELTRREDFPSFRLGRRIIIPKNQFLKWVEKQTEIENT